MNKFARAAAEACRELLGATVEDASQPGGRRRESVRVRLVGSSVIATRRPKTGRARLEVEVLRALGARTPHVPRILTFERGWLIQEDLGDLRLSQALAAADLPEAEAWLDAALSSLAAIHEAGFAAGLERRVAQIGRKDGWLGRLIAMPARLGLHLEMPPPPLPEERLVAFLRVSEPRFVKWDARPGNAVAREDGTVAWFDWEHCGARDRLDDMAWLLGDEYVDISPEVETRLLARHVGRFGGARSAEEAVAYLSAFGVFHMCVRLGLIVKYKADEDWWDPVYCLEGDKVGVTLEQGRRTALRAARWAARTELTRSLEPWLEGVAARLEEL